MITPRRLQYLLALIFLGLGGWCLLFPGTVERLALKPEFQIQSATSRLLMACFGAQACLVGILVGASKFTARTFLVFGLLASVPFFIFNWYFYFQKEMFTDLMLLDFAGNIGILTICLAGWRLSKKS